MNRRQYLAGVGTVTTAGFAVLAGCSGNDSGSGENGSSSETTAGDGAGASTPTEPTGDAGVTEGEALDTGQAPPNETGTPFENTNTVPDEEGLETGQASNASEASS